MADTRVIVNGMVSRGVRSAEIDGGQLVLVLTDGRRVTLGKIVPEKGVDYVDGFSPVIRSQREGETTHVIVTDVTGRDGSFDVLDGVSVTGAYVSDDGNLILQLSRGDEINAGYVMGELSPEDAERIDQAEFDSGNALAVAADAKKSADDALSKANISIARSDAAASTASQSMRAAVAAVGFAQTASATANNANTAADQAVLTAGSAYSAAQSAVETAGLALPKTGGTMSGVICMGGNSLTGLQEPAGGTDAATKAYVDAKGGMTREEREKLEFLASAADGTIYERQMDADEAYSKRLPMGALPYAEILRIGGKTVQQGGRLVSADVNMIGYLIDFNQLVVDPTFVAEQPGNITGPLYATNSVDGGVAKLSILNSSSGLGFLCSKLAPKILQGGNIYAMVCDLLYVTDVKQTTVRFLNSSMSDAAPQVTLNVSDAYQRVVLVCKTKDGLVDGNPLIYCDALGKLVAGDSISIKNLCIYNLTQMFGPGNEPDAEAFRAFLAAKLPAEWYPYNAGEVTAVGPAITIPDAVRALPGYGLSSGIYYNELDLQRRQYIQRVDESGPIPVPSVIDISDLIPEGFGNLAVEPGGSVTFAQAGGTALAVPYAVTWYIRRSNGGLTPEQEARISNAICFGDTFTEEQQAEIQAMIGIFSSEGVGF